MRLLPILQPAGVFLTAAAIATSSATASLTASATLTASASASSSGSATLSARANLTGSAAGTSAASARLTAGQALYAPPSPAGWKSTAARTGPDPDFSTGSRAGGAA
jgi:hypothetical protein